MRLLGRVYRLSQPIQYQSAAFPQRSLIWKRRQLSWAEDEHYENGEDKQFRQKRMAFAVIHDGKRRQDCNDGSDCKDASY